MNRALLLSLAVLAVSSAHASTTCRIVSGTSLAFGEYDFFARAPKDSLATVTVTCDRDGGPQQLDILMRVDQGSNGIGVGNRRMQHNGGSGSFLAYGLYRDVARSSLWGVTDNVDTVTASLSVPNKGSASAVFTIYGRIPVRQDMAAGTYSDSVQITILY